MASDENNKLLTVKKQVEKMFKNIQNLKSDEKNEAVGYLRKYLEDDKTKLKMKEKLRTRRSVRKHKIKNHTDNIKRCVFKCGSCGNTSKTKHSLLKHLETHMGTPITCIKCKKSFNSRQAYSYHVNLKICKAKINTIRYNCDQCPKFFRFQRHIKRHLEGHKRNNCTYCDVKLTRRKQLVEHLQSVHSIKLERAVLYKCDQCEKRYVKKRSLYYHMKQHAENKIVCMECGKMSANQEEHNIHYVGHDKDRPWKCERCNDRFSRRQQYLVHVKRHERYKCITCNKSHASKVHILRHKQRGHVVEGLEPQLKCPHCPNAFQRRLALQIHLRKHNEDKTMLCKFCDKSFRSPYLYFKHCATTIHEINSPEKRQLVCEICGKLFMKKYQVEQHLQRVHNQNKKIFTCEYCKYKTNNRKNMLRHRVLHLEDKKECICEQCGKAFYNLTTLKDHMLYVHSQERNFKCNQCDKAFKRNSELVRHQTCHSEARPHVCKTCGTSYKRSTHLRRHEESQHETITSNRRVQRLKKDETGKLVPVQEEKKPKTSKANKKKQKTEPKQVFSIIETVDQIPFRFQSEEMVTFTIPQVDNNGTLATVLSINNQQYSQDIIETVKIPYAEIWNDKIVSKSNIILNNSDNIMLASNVNNTDLNIVDQSFTNQILNEAPFLENVSNFNNMLQDVIPVDNSTTCDILLPESGNLEQNIQQNTENFLQNPYQYL